MKKRWEASLLGSAYTIGDDIISIMVSIVSPENQSGREVELKLTRYQAEGIITALRAITER